MTGDERGPGDPDRARVEEPEVERLPRSRASRLSASRRRLALLLALGVDFMQWIAFPLFLSGLMSPVVNVVDVIAAIGFTALLGWHWAFLPTFVVELIPGLALIPTWSLAVWIAIRGRAR